MRVESAVSSSPWVTTTMVRPSSFSSLKMAAISSELLLSRLPVGSSASSIAGSLTSALASATLCISPPESSLGRWSALSANPTLSSSCRALDSRSPLCRAQNLPGTFTFSRAVNVGMRKKCWKTKPMVVERMVARAFSESSPVSMPWTVTRPLVGRSRQPMRLRSVVLPEPDRPTMAR